MTLQSFFRLGLLLTLASLGTAAVGQHFPSRGITIIVPYPAGGTGDVAARAVAGPMAIRLGRPVMIENISGGSALIGTARVARAAPDGYTLLVHQLAIAGNAPLFPKAPFNVARDLTGIGLINYSLPILVGRKSLAANSVSELVAWMKQPGQRAKFAHAGIGSQTHFCAILFARAVGADVELIPYRGGTPAVSDIIAGHVDLYCTNTANEYIKAGSVKGYGIAGKEQLASFPAVPSLVQLGFADLDILSWQGMFAPARTPKPILEKLNAALRDSLADPKVIANFERTDFSTFPENQQTLSAANSLLHAEIARWTEVVRANNIEGAQ
jgi:tripartite-type tricarboxylate transporter receptor subunit TctC